jgi:hypothetical protein
VQQRILGIIAAATCDDRNASGGLLDANLDHTVVFGIRQGGIFPVVPQGTNALEPFSICQSTKRRKVGSSNAPSRKGVTRAGMEPENIDFILFHRPPIGDMKLRHAAPWAGAYYRNA